MKLRALAIFLAVACWAANIACERLLMHMAVAGAVLVPGFADLRPEWNSGVSFSLLAQNSATGRYLLIAVLSVIIIGVAWVMWRTSSRIAATGFGLILGGALGNLLDRLEYGGAVFDFLALHLGRLPLFVCNLSDIWISAGVVLLFAESLLKKPVVPAP